MKIKVFTALEMLSWSWESTKRDIVVNCFRKVRFRDGIHLNEVRCEANDGDGNLTLTTGVIDS